MPGLERSRRGPGEVLERSRRGPGEVLERSPRGPGEVPERSWRGPGKAFIYGGVQNRRVYIAFEYGDGLDVGGL